MTLGILIPLAAAAREHPWGEAWFLIPTIVAGCLGLAGLYTLAAVYAGWWLPQTAVERIGQPRLSDAVIRQVGMDGKLLVFEVGVKNEGKEDVPNGIVNLLVPDWATNLARSSDGGSPIHVGSVLHTAETLDGQHGSWYWTGTEVFPGVTAKLLYFRVKLPEARNLPIKLKVSSSALAEPFEQVQILEVRHGT